MSALASRFDWYEATFETWAEVAFHLAVGLGATVTREKGRNGYAEGQAVVRGTDELARVYSRSVRQGEVHVVITGQACDEVVPLFRRLWPEHRISRADSAVDLVLDFEQLDAAALEFARRKGLGYRLITDSDGGATRYLGSSTSEVRVRVYKKSEQLRAAHPERASEVPDGIVRVELQARPSKRAAKEAAGRMSADGLWGLARWTQALASELLQVEADRLSTHFRRPSSWARAAHYLGVQYGPLVRSRADEVGREAAIRELVEVMGL